jgi:hypothetical protein
MYLFSKEKKTQILSVSGKYVFTKRFVSKKGEKSGKCTILRNEFHNFVIPCDIVRIVNSGYLEILIFWRLEMRAGFWRSLGKRPPGKAARIGSLF